MSRLAAFPRWWGRELAALVPGPLRRLFGGQPRWLLLDIDDTQAVLSRSRDGRRLRELGRAGRARGGLEDLMNRRLGGHRLAVRVPAGWALLKQLTLPAATEENLRQVLAFEMDRQTPFRAEDVFFNHDIVARDKELGKITVNLTVLPRQRVDEVLAIVENAGAQASVLEVGREAGGDIGAANLLPQGDRQEMGPAFGVLNWLLLVIAVTLMAALIYLTIDRQRQVLSLLDARADSARQAAQAVPILRDKVAAIGKEAGFLHGRKASSVSKVLLLNDLSRLLPDHTWLTKFELTGREVRLTGYSSSSSEVLRLIEASPRFIGARFLAPLTQDTRRNAEKFSLTANLSPRPDDGN